MLFPVRYRLVYRDPLILLRLANGELDPGRASSMKLTVPAKPTTFMFKMPGRATPVSLS